MRQAIPTKASAAAERTCGGVRMNPGDSYLSLFSDLGFHGLFQTTTTITELLQTKHSHLDFPVSQKCRKQW